MNSFSFSLIQWYFSIGIWDTESIQELRAQSKRDSYNDNNNDNNNIIIVRIFTQELTLQHVMLLSTCVLIKSNGKMEKGKQYKPKLL